jgi:uncharacterized protein with HEPN domain
MIATRNRIAHGYASLDWAIVWDIVELELGDLRAAVDALIDKSDDDAA